MNYKLDLGHETYLISYNVMFIYLYDLLYLKSLKAKKLTIVLIK